jgi:hypothetical protein
MSNPPPEIQSYKNKNGKGYFCVISEKIVNKWSGEKPIEPEINTSKVLDIKK